MLVITKEHGIVELKKEGFWVESDGYDSDGCYKTPIPNESMWDGQEIFLRKLKELEDYLLNEYKIYVENRNAGIKLPYPSYVLEYRGSSSCRICGCKNGYLEFRQNGWTWPSGYRHYIEKHNIKPSEEFIDMIMNYKNLMVES
jgi:hypothetical protein